MKQKKHFLLRMLAGKDTLPLAEWGKIEVTGKDSGRSVLIENVKRILLYSQEEMQFLRADGLVSIRGKALDCISYASGAIGISGEIHEILFQKGEETE